MPASLMHLKVVLPSAVLLEASQVRRMVIETPAGAYGLLPRRLDCVSILAPGIVSYETADNREHFIAVDEGVMIKHDQHVSIAVRRAFAGDDLSLLQAQLQRFYEELETSETDRHRHKRHLESGFLRRFADFRNV